MQKRILKHTTSQSPKQQKTTPNASPVTYEQEIQASLQFAQGQQNWKYISWSQESISALS